MSERTYTFKEPQYHYKVVYIGYIMVAIILYSLVKVLFYGQPLWGFPMLIAVYGAGNTFLWQSNPRQVIVTDETITFRSYGEKTFDVSKLTFCRLRVSTAGYQVYVRVADSEGKKGRFWVNYAMFNDKVDLLDEFNYLEKKVHPESLRFRGRDDYGTTRPVKQVTDEDLAIAETIDDGEKKIKWFGSYK